MFSPHRIATALLIAGTLAAGGCAGSGPPTTVPPGQVSLAFADGGKYVGEMQGGLRQGQGTYTWPDGRKYVGTFRDGLPNGQGTYSFPNGESYTGEFHDNRREGQGTYSWPDGRKYVGTFRDNRPNGRGVFTWASGKRYEGEVANGQPNGQGTYTWPDGRRYVGGLKDDQPDGQGTFIAADGREQTGYFRRGEYVGPVATPAALRAENGPGNAPKGGEVALQSRGGTLTVTGTVNDGAPIEFFLDSGAADVSVPSRVFEELRRAGTVTPEDILGKETYQLADGKSVTSVTFRIRTLKIGTLTLTNVRGSVSAYDGPPLLGMSFLGRFHSWSVDNDRRVLVLK